MSERDDADARLPSPGEPAPRDAVLFTDAHGTVWMVEEWRRTVWDATYTPTPWLEFYAGGRDARSVLAPPPDWRARLPEMFAASSESVSPELHGRLPPLRADDPDGEKLLSESMRRSSAQRQRWEGLIAEALDTPAVSDSTPSRD
jgi:hypothetical protein